MLLRDIKTYLAERKRASLSDLQARFEMDADALRAALAHWTRKGRIRRVAETSACGGCEACPPPVREIYEWVGPESPISCRLAASPYPR